MLTPKDKKQIYQCGVSTYHDYWFMSLFFGEPFFEKGITTYYDGRIVTVCGFPLNGDSEIKNAEFRHIAKRWVIERKIDGLLFIGPRPVDFSFLKNYGFRRTELQSRCNINSELSIDCTNNPESVLNKRIYRRTQLIEFESKVKSGGIVSAENIRLIEQFYQKEEISGYLAVLAYSIPCILKSQRVWLIEARKDKQLCGLLALHKPFADIAMALFMVHDHCTVGVSDFLYCKMLDQAKRVKANKVNIGTSHSEGAYNFKIKWGGRPEVSPLYFVKWMRGHLARHLYTSWGLRLIKL